MVNVTAFVYDKIIFISVYWVLFLKHIENEWPSSICTLIERNTKLLYKFLLLLKSQILNQIRLWYTHAKKEKTTCWIPVDDTAVYAYVVQMNILKNSLQYIFVLSLNIVIPYSSITSCTNRSFENLKFNKGVFIWLGWV